MRTLGSQPSFSRSYYVFFTGVIVSIVVATLALFNSTAVASVNAPIRAGKVVVVDPADPLKTLSNGGSATKFSLRLPADASCPGDSENDQWRVQSFVVPATDDSGALHYGEIAPDGKGRWPLYSLDTHAFVHILTLPNSVAGQPGRIDIMPTFSFVLFPPSTLPGGRYRVGIACTYFRKTAKYWDTELDLTASATDQPGKLVWRVVDLSDTPTSSSDSSIGQWAGVAAAAVGVTALTLVLWQRSNRRAKQLLKEQS